MNAFIESVADSADGVRGLMAAKLQTVKANEVVANVENSHSEGRPLCGTS